MGSSVIANDVSLSSSPNATFFGRQSVTLPIQDAIFQFKITGLFQDLDSTKQIIVLRLFALNLMGLARRAGQWPCTWTKNRNRSREARVYKEMP